MQRRDCAANNGQERSTAAGANSSGAKQSLLWERPSRIAEYDSLAARSIGHTPFRAIRSKSW